MHSSTKNKGEAKCLQRSHPKSSQNVPNNEDFNSSDLRGTIFNALKLLHIYFFLI